jgi:hypothetical protein
MAARPASTRIGTYKLSMRRLLSPSPYFGFGYETR